MTIPAPTLPINLIDDAPMQVVLDDRTLLALDAIRHEISALFWLIFVFSSFYIFKNRK